MYGLFPRQSYQTKDRAWNSETTEFKRIIEINLIKSNRGVKMIKRYLPVIQQIIDVRETQIEEHDNTEKREEGLTPDCIDYWI